MNITKDELKDRIKRVEELASPCRLCPRVCGIDRKGGDIGFCRTGSTAKIYSYRCFKGEEPPISGRDGSGVIFFSHCTMRCAYCQNSRFSQDGEGYAVDPERLSKIMIHLKDQGCHNINLVTPTHYLPTILAALYLSRESLQDLPVVYNTSGFESKETLDILDGIIDVYLADMRYGDNEAASRFSQTPGYVEVNRAAIHEMYSQVGRLSIASDGAARKGLIIRHLVMPNQLANTDTVLNYISSHISMDLHISLMSQYLPIHKAEKIPEISRPITQEEYDAACALLTKYNLTNGWTQSL